MKQIRLFDIPGIDRYFLGCYIHSIDHGDFKSLKNKLKWVFSEWKFRDLTWKSIFKNIIIQIHKTVWDKIKCGN